MIMVMGVIGENVSCIDRVLFLPYTVAVTD